MRHSKRFAGIDQPGDRQRPHDGFDVQRTSQKGPDDKDRNQKIKAFATDDTPLQRSLALSIAEVSS
jgi:hypothetical protein